MRRVLAVVLLASSVGPFRAADPHRIEGFAPISVSSANYRNSTRDELKRAVAAGHVNAAAPALSARADPVQFIFMPGEITLPDPRNPDPTFEDLCLMMTPALAQKGYINAADADGIIREPEKVTLVLRLHYGERDWRLPVVRTEHLSWSDGLVPRVRGRSLTTGGGSVVWDARAGGNDNAFAALSKNDANSGSFWGASGGGTSAAGGAGPAPLAAPSTGNVAGSYEGTRAFHIIVVDAFDYLELKEKGKAARRIWTTFAAAPKQGKQPFGEVASTLIRNATPFFGETSSGLQVYTDARAEVTIGEATVVPE